MSVFPLVNSYSSVNGLIPYDRSVAKAIHSKINCQFLDRSLLLQSGGSSTRWSTGFAFPFMTKSVGRTNVLVGESTGCLIGSSKVRSISYARWVPDISPLMKSKSIVERNEVAVLRINISSLIGIMEAAPT